MTHEYDEALEQVAGSFVCFLGGPDIHPNTLLSELNETQGLFLNKVTVEELRKVIELANCYADLCE